MAMNWLHHMKPPFIHRDFKTGNLLVCCSNGMCYDITDTDLTLRRSMSNGTLRFQILDCLRSNHSTKMETKSLVPSVHHIIWHQKCLLTRNTTKG